MAAFPGCSEFGHVGCMRRSPIARPMRSPPSPLLAHTLSLPMPFSPSAVGPVSAAQLRPTSAPALCNLLCSPVQETSSLQMAAAAVQDDCVLPVVVLELVATKRRLYTGRSMLRITYVVLDAVAVSQLDQLNPIVQECLAVADVCYCQEVSDHNSNCEGCACNRHKQHLSVMTAQMMQVCHTK